MVKGHSKVCVFSFLAWLIVLTSLAFGGYRILTQPQDTLPLCSAVLEPDPMFGTTHCKADLQ